SGVRASASRLSVLAERALMSSPRRSTEQESTSVSLVLCSRAEKYMRRLFFFSTALILAVALASLAAQQPTPVSAPTDGGYKLVPNWPTLPPGEFFGKKTPPAPPAERDAQAAARRATGGGGGGTAANAQGPTNQPGISGLAID